MKISCQERELKVTQQSTAAELKQELSSS